jgi:hypothetical protein
VEREEFVNAGIIVFCKRKRFIKMRYKIDEPKLLMLDPEIDLEQLRLNLESFEKVAHGAKDGGPIALFETAERFRWLTAVRSSVIQTSRPHPGMCTDMENTADRLFKEFVL